MFGSHSFLSILILLPWAFFSPLSPPAHYRTPPLYVPSPLTFFPLCSSLFPLTLSHARLSLHPFAGTVLLIMPVIGVTHTFSVCLDQIKNIVSILPTRPLLAELNGLCSVPSAAN